MNSFEMIAKAAADTAAATQAKAAKAATAKAEKAAKAAAAKAAKAAAKASEKAAEVIAEIKAEETAKAEETQQTATRQPVAFFVRQGFRPSAGRMLFSYTHAWIVQSGLADGGSIDASAARKIAGDTAVSYHTNKTGCFSIVAGKLTLTAAGQSKFGGRATIGASLDGKAVDAFIETLTTGKTNDYVKAEFAIGKL